MKRTPALLIAVFAMAVAWPVVAWSTIWLGHLVDPKNIHNVISLFGALILGPVSGICAGIAMYRALRKSNPALGD
ncbi:MAG TPA: hypothetical protein VH437_17145 [Terriglobales bacterium]